MPFRGVQKRIPSLFNSGFVSAKEIKRGEKRFDERKMNEEERRKNGTKMKTTPDFWPFFGRSGVESGSGVSRD